MNRFLISLLFTVVFAAAVAAETVVVRSGEHTGFTRLVMRLPSKVDWGITESSQAFDLNYDLPDVHFDVSQVFNRIPRLRLVGLAQSGPGAALVFTLGCNCIVRSFTEPNGFLVIDIRDSEEEKLQSRRRIEMPVNQEKYRFSSVSKPVSEGLSFPVVPVRPSKGMVPIARGIQRTADRMHSGRGAINASEERLIAQINRAASQGLLEVSNKTEKAHVGDAFNSVQPAKEPDELARAVELHSSVSLSATTVFDRDSSIISHLTNPERSGPFCFESSQVALQDWVENEPFSEEIGKWRTRAFGEFDKVNSTAALNLARAYLHFGFGAEARAALLLSADLGEHSQVLEAIADVLEYGAVSGENPFEGQHVCDGDVALWSVLAAKVLPENVNKGAVHMAFSRLPLHLRGYLGPKISQKFSSANDSKMAASILRTMDRVRVDSGTGVELARAAVAQLQGDVKTVERELSKTVEQGAENSAKALVQLVQTVYAEGNALAPELPGLAAAYAVEYRNAEAGAEIRRAHTLALALNGQFGEAFEALLNLEVRDGVLAWQAAMVPLMDLLSERADDVTFLRFSLPAAVEVPTSFPAEISENIARRLLYLGFVEDAELWISDTASMPGSPAGQLLRAEISLARRLPHRATFELSGAEGVEAARLRALAFSQYGNYQKSGQMSVLAEDFDSAARGFWLADDWDEVPEQSNGRYEQAVAGAKSLQKVDPNVEKMTPLAQARVLMQNSLEARAGVSSLLQAISVGSLSQ